MLEVRRGEERRELQEPSTRVERDKFMEYNTVHRLRGREELRRGGMITGLVRQRGETERKEPSDSERGN